MLTLANRNALVRSSKHIFDIILMPRHLNKNNSHTSFSSLCSRVGKKVKNDLTGLLMRADHRLSRSVLFSCYVRLLLWFKIRVL